MSLTKDYITDTKWQFGSHLTIEHVWDVISIIVCLLEHKIRQGQHLRVPHNRLQKGRFTDAMAERNREIILNGQPDAVGHVCDKCMRIYKTEEGESVNIVCTRNACILVASSLCTEAQRRLVAWETVEEQ